MSIATDSDLQIQAAVQAELEWTPDVDAAGIGVAVEDGAVTLTGEVDNYAERLAAKHAALRLRGVRAVVDAMAAIATETDIAKEVERALRTAVNVPATVQATLDGHHVTLTGEVQWDFQRVAAKRAVQYLRGVYSVNNMITLTARPSAEDAEERIKKAITRNAQLDATSIEVSAKGNTVTLTGSVASWAERRQAERAAWASPHVTDVVNRIQVRPF